MSLINLLNGLHLQILSNLTIQAVNDSRGLGFQGEFHPNISQKETIKNVRHIEKFFYFCDYIITNNYQKLNLIYLYL
ncbi:MAG: hypothetical protein Q8842_03010, partial [Candidatus Phytoplasma australasiaticum]|nr:hypothetical protein [Candidatus Phytoplasma australasiaticum]